MESVKVVPIERNNLINQGAPAVRISQEEAEHFIHTNAVKYRLISNSVGKSGTTWIRGILSTLPGYHSVDVNQPGFTGGQVAELNAVEPGEVFHGHFVFNREVENALRQNDFRGINIFRDLRDAIVSEYHHHLFMNPASPLHEMLRTMPKEEAFMLDNLLEWCGAAIKFKESTGWVDSDALISVRYEDLKALPVATLRTAMSSIGIHISYSLLEKIVYLNSFERMTKRKPGDEMAGGTLRKGVVGDWQNHLSQRNLEEIEKYFGPHMKELGYTW